MKESKDTVETVTEAEVEVATMTMTITGAVTITITISVAKAKYQHRPHYIPRRRLLLQRPWHMHRDAIGGSCNVMAVFRVPAVVLPVLW